MVIMAMIMTIGNKVTIFLIMQWRDISIYDRL
jgi:hypothetical protein